MKGMGRRDNVHFRCVTCGKTDKASFEGPMPAGWHVVQVNHWPTGCDNLGTLHLHVCGECDSKSDRDPEVRTTKLRWVEDLAILREAGYSVAVHNDYRVGQESFTFWLFTHPDGTWVKGEGADDAAALQNVCANHDEGKES